MLAVSGELPASAGWAYELKWDGVRAIGVIRRGQLRLYARSGAEITAAYPELAALAGELATDAVLDGEVVAFGADGRPSFTALAERIHVREKSRAARLAAAIPVTYMVFDLLRLGDEDLTGRPYRQRREALERAVPPGAHWLVPPTFTDGPATLAAAEEHALEGVVAKRLDSVYRPGTRSPDWVKIKREQTEDFVVGGWRPGERRLGALLVGSPVPGGLAYRGRVGGGISGAAERALLAALEPLRTAAPPFLDEVPREDARGATWVRPELVVEVRYGDRTPDGRLRFPRFVRLRPDRVPSDFVPSPTTSEVRVRVAGRDLQLSNLDKVLYPAAGFTKGEIIDYYSRVAPVLLPRLAGRPLTRIRYPNGVTQASFFEKNAPAGTPPWVHTVTLPVPGSSTGRETLDFVVADDLPTLIWLANLAAIELHTPQWRIGAGGPDLLVIDLDPGPPAGLAECAEAALLVRERLAADGLTTVAKTSGRKGMQLYAPVSATQPADVVTGYAKRVAEELARAHPRQITAQMAKRLRPGKVFIDWSQNSAAKTTVAPYSLRAEPTPSVSAPLLWSEVESGQVRRFTPADVLDRVDEHGDLLEALDTPGPPVAGPPPAGAS